MAALWNRMVIIFLSCGFFYLSSVFFSSSLILNHSNFWPMPVVAKWLDGLRCHLVWPHHVPGPGDIVLNGDPAPLPPKGHSRLPALFGPCLFCPNGWMEQDASWYGGRPRSRRHCVMWGRSSSPQKGSQHPPILAYVYCCQTVGWIKMTLGMEVGLGPSHIVLHGDPVPPPQKGHSPQFLDSVCCGQTAGWIKMLLGMATPCPRPR